MTSEGSITHWFRLLQDGNSDAAQPLWDRYFSRLESLARQMLQGKKFAAADMEDVALSAFDSLCRGIQRGRFPSLEDRDNLWNLLVVITARKVAHLLRDQQRQKRGGELLSVSQMKEGTGGLEEVMGQEPTPDFAAQAGEEYERLLNSLARDDLKQVAIWKMEGYTNQEIADRLSCAVRTVDRKLRLIRHIWEKEAEP